MSQDKKAGRGRRQLAAHEEQELRSKLELLAYEGRQVEGTSPEIDINTRPDYYDAERFARAQATVNKYYVSVSMSSTVGLLLLLQFDEILVPLLKTGKSRTVADLYERYTATAKYMKRAYESPFLEQDSDGWRYISLVRSMHRRAFELLNSQECEHLEKPKCRARDEGKYVWVNQYDMAMTQFAFVGLFVLRPDKCGAYRVGEAELSDVVYYWRLMSHQFGLEEQYNIFAYHEDMARQYQFLSILLDHYKDKLASSRSPVGLEMSRGFLLSFEKLATETTFNILEHHWHGVISMSGSDKLLPYAGLGERWKLLRFNLIMKLLFKSDTMVGWMNGAYKRKLDRFCAKGERMKGKLAKKYPNHVYEMNVAGASNLQQADGAKMM